MKTLMKVLLGLALGGAAIVAVVFWATAGLPEAADGFFKKLAAKDYPGALALTTADFKASTSADALAEFARSNGLDGYSSASWSSRSIDGSTGKLEGSLAITGGGVVPVSVTLVKSDGQWLVQNVEKATAGLSTSSTDTRPAAAPKADVATTPVLPSADEQRALVKETLSAFAQSVNADDFSILHATLATPFQEQVSVEQLRESFAEFVDEEIDLSVLDPLTPELDAQSGFDEDGALLLVGSYPTEPSEVGFTLRYVNEADQWRLLKINVKVD